MTRPGMTREVWITGIGLVSSLGEGAAPHAAALAGQAAPVVDATAFAPFPIHPAPALNLDSQIPKKGDQRQMEPWQRLGTYAAGLAIDSANARALVGDMHLVVAAGGGERDIALDEAIAAELVGQDGPAGRALLNERLANGLRPTLFLAQLSNLLAGNISIVHGVTGSSRTFMGEESAAADAVRIAAQRLAEGRGEIALVGGAYVAARWDMLLVYGPGGVLWQGDWAPVADRMGQGGGMVTGTVAAFLVLETAEAARARGAACLGRLGPVVTDAARRRGEDSSEAAGARLFARVKDQLAPGYAVLSGATGVAAPTEAERAFLARAAEAGPAQGKVTLTADLLGHAMEASFPANLALATLALQAPSPPPQVLVTGFGQWRAEALAVVAPAAGGAA